MIDIDNAIKEAGLTHGEAKVYLALLKIGQNTVGPIIEQSKVANSIIYRILNSLMEKGLVSYIIKDKIRYYQAENPKKIIEYIEKKETNLEKSKQEIRKIIPNLLNLGNTKYETSVQVYEGFKGIQTAFEHYHDVLKKGEEIISWGIYPFQEEKYHIYWQKDHIKRGKKGIKCKMLFNQGTDKKILKNRNSYKLCDARYMPINIKTPAWFMAYKDTTLIILQKNKEMAIEIINKDVADTFRVYFEDLWKNAKK
jgi:sugar-specific transcriptional regulator TrmB